MKRFIGKNILITGAGSSLLANKGLANWEICKELEIHI